MRPSDLRPKPRARALLSTAALLGLALTIEPAFAAEYPSAKAAYQAARGAFDAGRYEEAADAFEAAYGLDPNPALLANAAEARRVAGDCPGALALYERYLAEAKDEANARIRENAESLRAKCGEAPAPRPESPPPASEPADIDEPREAPPAAGARATESEGETPLSNWQLGLEAGVGWTRFAEARSTDPLVRLTVGRTWWMGRLGIGAGLGAQWTTLAYAAAPGAPDAYSARATALEAVAEAQVRLLVGEGLALRLDLGGGLAWFSGFDAFSELSADGAAAAPGVTPALRSALGAEVALPVEGLGLRFTGLAVSFVPAPTGAAGPRLALQAGAGLSYAL